MWSYIVRRLLYTIPIVFGVLLVTFVLFKLVPGDPSLDIAGKNASAEEIREIREALGFNKPRFLNFEAAEQGPWYRLFDSQLVDHLWKTASFQFGKSITSKQPVLQIIGRGAGPSLTLQIPIFLGLLTTAIPLALFAAYKRGTPWDLGLVILAVAGLSMPYLAIILFGQYFFGYVLDWFPVHVFGAPTARDFVLPALLGIVAGAGGNVRFYRTVMLDEMRSDYIRTAYAKGVGTRRVLFVHLLKNAMIPIITMVVLAIPFLFLGSLLLERFFGIPGLGYLMIEAINSRDYPIITAMTFIISLLFVIGQLLTDICYALVDPRIKLS